MDLNFYRLTAMLVVVLFSLSHMTASTVRRNWSVNLIGYGSTLLAMTAMLKTQGISAINTIGLENIRLQRERKVAGLPSWVDQKVSNAEGCIRMCWLYSACSAATFTQNEQRCQLYQTDRYRQIYRTEFRKGSLAVDMRDARILPTQVSARIIVFNIITNKLETKCIVLWVNKIINLKPSLSLNHI